MNIQGVWLHFPGRTSGRAVRRSRGTVQYGKIHASVRGREEMRSALAASLKVKGPLHVQLPHDAPGKTNKMRN